MRILMNKTKFWQWCSREKRTPLLLAVYIALMGAREKNLSLTLRGRTRWSRNGLGIESETKGDNMKADLIIPIDSLRGMLRKDGYYFRMYRGTQVVQRCPNRSGHVKTEGELANQQRFVEQYGKKKTGI